MPVNLASADTLADRACEEATKKYNEEMGKRFPEGKYPPYVCVPVPDVNAPGGPGSGGESRSGGASTDTSSSSEQHEAWESPSAPADVEEPAAPRDDSPIPTGPHSDTDEPSVAGAKSQAALRAMQDKENPADRSGKPGSSNANGSVNTPLGKGSSNMALGNNASSALTGDLTEKKPATMTEPLPAVTEATPQSFMGTVVDTAQGLAVQVGGDLIPVEDTLASTLTPGQNVELSEDTLTAQQESSVVDLRSLLGIGQQYEHNTEQYDTTTPQDIIPPLLIGLIAAMLPALRQRSRTQARTLVGSSPYLQQQAYGLQRATMPYPVSRDGGPGPALPTHISPSRLGEAAPTSNGNRKKHPDYPPDKKNYGERPTVRPKDYEESAPALAAAGATAKVMGDKFGPLSAKLFDHFINNNGKDVKLTEAEVNTVMATGGPRGERPDGSKDAAPNSIAPTHDEAFKNSAQLQAAAQEARDSGKEVSGVYADPKWTQVSSSNNDAYYALGGFSAAASTEYTVYPGPEGQQRVEATRTIYIYDWYDFSADYEIMIPTSKQELVAVAGSMAISNAITLETVGLADNFQVTGNTSPKTYEITV